MPRIKSSLLRRKSGILLDIGCGEKKFASHWVGMDRRRLPGVDIVHDLEVLPWPLPDSCCKTILAANILEHLKPWLTIDIFNEMWRVMCPGGNLIVHVPYGVGPQYVKDPTHCNPFNEATFFYFDPEPQGRTTNPLYDIYRPKPWKMVRWYWDPVGMMEVIMEKRS